MPIADIERVALAIAKGGLFGSKDPNAVLTLCLLAHAEGQHPAVVFRDYHIIQGKPAKKADAMLRDFINAGGSVKWHQLDDAKADATFSHPSGEARIDWTLDRAKKAGIANPMWSKYPRQMLRSRVISEGVRTVYPGATSGLYEENEVRDIVAETPREEAPAFIEDKSGIEPADYAPPEPIAGETVTTDYAFPKGPATGITQLKAMARSLWREIEGCGDDSELDPLLATDDNKALMKQLAELENPAHLEIWLGDGKDNPGLSGLIIRKQTEFAQALGPNILQAG
jgi:hypothetical protein